MREIACLIIGFYLKKIGISNIYKKAQKGFFRRNNLLIEIYQFNISFFDNSRNSMKIRIFTSGYSGDIEINGINFSSKKLKFLELEKVNLKLEKNDDTPFFNVSSDQKTKKNIINILNTQLLSILLKSANKIVVLRSFSIEKKREKINFTELTLTNVGSVLKIIARKKDIEIRFNIHYSIANNFVLFKNHSTIEINNIRFNLSFSRNSSDKATFVFLLNISDWVVIKEFLKRIKMENLYLLPIDGGRFGLMIQVDVLIKESKNYVKAFVRPFNQLIYSNHFYLKCPFSHLVTSENIGSKSITISKEYTNHLSINLIL